jgi:plastocyanin
MKRVRAGCTALLALGFAVACAKDAPTGGEQIAASDVSVDAASSNGSSSDRDSDGPGGSRFIAIRDDCDPTDPAWTPTGGCMLRRGNVRFAEFADELDSPFSTAVVGHQAWWNDPPYLVIRAGRTVRVRNEGGRTHTFTKVAEFGGGKVPPPGGTGLNKGLVTAPECPESVDIRAGESARVSGLGAGNHRFQCCIHPWMRAIIKVKAN